MKSRLQKEDIKLLTGLGFKVEYPDEIDPTYCQYIKRFKKHPLLKGLYLMVDNQMIEVWCNESKKGMSSGGEVLIACFDYNRDKLLSLLMLLS